jgi:CheY-like chemotaxis protein
MSRLRIAIADDDPRMRSYVVYLVKMLGHKVSVQVENGAKLVEQCLAIVPDLIISDMQMPVLNGLEAVDRIWETNPIPAILVSGLPESELFAGRSPGPKPFYLMKPFNLHELTESIRGAAFELARRDSAPPSAVGKPNAVAGAGPDSGQAASWRARTETRNENARLNRYEDKSGRISPLNSSTSYPAKLSAKHGPRSGDR